MGVHAGACELISQAVFQTLLGLDLLGQPDIGSGVLITVSYVVQTEKQAADRTTGQGLPRLGYTPAL